MFKYKVFFLILILFLLFSFSAFGDGCTNLMKAIKHGNLSQVKEFVPKCDNIDDKLNDFHDVPLILAADKGNMPIVNYLIYSGANVNVTNYAGMFPLGLAVYHNNMPLVKLLLDNGSKMFLYKNDELLFSETGSSHYNVYNLDNPDDSIDIAISQNNLKILKYLVSRMGNLSEDKNSHNLSTYLSTAIKKGNLSILEYLLSKGVKINVQNDYNILVYNAILSEKIEMLQFLKDQGVDFTKDSQLIGDLGYAMSNFIPAFKFLLDNGVDINSIYDDTYEIGKSDNLEVRDNIVYGPMIYSLINTANNLHNIKIFEIMLNHGLNVNLKNKSTGATLLMYHVINNNIDIVKLLLSKGAKVNMKDNNGQTALMYANKMEMVQLLLSNGADLNITDNNGQTALNILKDSDNQNLVTFVENYGKK